jgi:hypothetical protein
LAPTDEWRERGNVGILARRISEAVDSDLKAAMVFSRCMAVAKNFVTMFPHVAETIPQEWNKPLYLTKRQF